MEKSKEKLLEHYKHKEPTLFVQYDGFDLQDGGDDVMRPDDEGHWLSTRLTYELMSGGPNVRMLITPETSKDTILALLNKIKRWIRKSDDWHFAAKKELKKFNKLKKIESECQKMSENGYTLDDIEYLFDSIKVMLNKKRQEENMPKDIVDEELPF